MNERNTENKGMIHFDGVEIPTELAAEPAAQPEVKIFDSEVRVTSYPKKKAPAAKSASEAEAKPAPKAEAKPAPKAATKPESKIEAKPAPKAAAKPAPKAEAKPAPKASAIVNEIDFAKTVAKIKAELAKDVVGQADIIDSVIIAIVAGGNVLLEGVPGVGKTRLVRSLGKVLSLPFSRIQFTPDLMPSDVTGTNIVEKDENGRLETKFRRGPIFANLVLADEINRATPKTQSAMLEVMQEHKVTVDSVSYKIEEPFFVLATENPIEQDGTYPLPEAQMDRFMFKLLVGFPSAEELEGIVKMTQITMAETAEAVVGAEDILAMRALASRVPVIDEVLKYAVELVSNTHPELGSSAPSAKKYVKYGASPRAAQAIITAAKVKALMGGRFNVSYDDIDELARPVLRHRIKVNYSAVNDKLTTDDVIGMIIKETKKVR